MSKQLRNILIRIDISKKINETINKKMIYINIDASQLIKILMCLVLPTFLILHEALTKHDLNTTDMSFSSH